MPSYILGALTGVIAVLVYRNTQKTNKKKLLKGVYYKII